MWHYRVDRSVLRNVCFVQREWSRGKCNRPVPEIGKFRLLYKNLPDYPHPDFEDNEFLPRRHSYWPPGIGQHRERQRIKPWWKVKEKITLYPAEDEPPEYTQTPQYPPITDYRIYDNGSEQKHNRLAWYNKIKAMPSLDEKAFEIADSRDHATIMVAAWSHAYNNLPMFKHVTKTNLITGLPDLYNDIDVGSYRDAIKSHLIDAVQMHLAESKRKQIGRSRNSNIMPKEMRKDTLEIENLIEDVTAIAIKILSKDHPNLLEHQVGLKATCV